MGIYPTNDIIKKPELMVEKVEVLDQEEYAMDLIHKMKTYIQSHRNDFQQFYSPSDDIYGESRSGNDSRPSWADLERLGNERCGFGWQLTKGLAADAVRNGFEFVTYDGKIEPKEDIFKWTIKSDFHNQLEDLVRYERIYGASFFMKYWGKNDDYSKPAPKRPPTKFQAFPPTILTPINLTDTKYLDYDAETWDFQGGNNTSVEIHRSRVHVLITRPSPYAWWGLSIFEPIYLSASGYLNLMINGMKMMAKYGNVVTSFTMAEENPSLELYQEYEELINEFKAAYTFILGKGEEINFQDTKISNGLQEFAEFLKEDISSGSGVPLNALFGRAVSGGIGGAGALTAERGKIQTISNIQHNISDDVWKIISDCGWNIDDLMVRFRLDLQKTEMAKHEERSMELQNFILEEQLKTLQLGNMMQAMQMQEMVKNPELMMGLGQPGQEGGQGGKMLPDKSGDKSGSNPANKTKHAMGGGKQAASKNDEKNSLTGKMKRNQDLIGWNQDFLKNNIETYTKIKNQFEKRRSDN